MSLRSPDAFTSRTYQSFDGLRLHYRDYSGPADAPFTGICVHGLTSTCRVFEDLAVHLAARYRVLCGDLRGRGGSELASRTPQHIPSPLAGEG